MTLTTPIAVVIVHKFKIEKKNWLTCVIEHKKNFFLSTKIQFDEKSNIRAKRELQKDIRSQRIDTY